MCAADAFRVIIYMLCTPKKDSCIRMSCPVIQTNTEHSIAPK